MITVIALPPPGMGSLFIGSLPPEMSGIPFSWRLSANIRPADNTPQAYRWCIHDLSITDPPQTSTLIHSLNQARCDSYSYLPLWSKYLLIPSNHQDASKHHFPSVKNELISYIQGFKINIFVELFNNNTIFFICHVIFIHYKSTWCWDL